MSLTDEGHYGPKQLNMLKVIWGEGYLSPGGSDEIDEIIGDLDLSNKKILDIGCGTGGAVFHLLEKHNAAEAIGYDPEPLVIEKANELAVEKNLSDRANFYCIEPGSIQASLDSRSKKIGVIGTVATINSKAYDTALRLVDKYIQVFSKECPLFVPFVEEGMVEGEAVNIIVEHYLSSFKNNIDTMILGCTHYPLLKPVIKDFVKDIKLVDSVSAIATHAKNILVKKSLMSEVVNSNELECFVTDLPRKFEKLGEIFLGEIK